MRSLSYIDQEAFVTYVEINKKHSSNVVVLVIVKNVSYICRPWKGVVVKRQPFTIC